MNADRWERIQNLFHEAADLNPPERGAFLERACHGDAELRSEVLALLEEDQASTILDRDMGQIAEELLGEEPKGASGKLPFEAIGPYRISRLLGEGGMGVVYLAERDDLGSRVAIKILRDAWMSPARRQRFTLEQRTLAQLSHPSIARLYDADTLPDGTPWFAMEYVEGVPLTEYCRARSSPIEERLRLFRAICEAVDYAHRHAIIHRDLKPSNILVKTDGEARLLDFGIAKQMDPSESGGDLTRTGLRLMTPAYAAPEQIRGEPASIQTDVYSLGVVLYELLTGHAPFDPDGRSPGELETAILTQDPVKPSASAQASAGAHGGLALSKAQWADLDVLCLTAMHKDSARRYRSVEAVIRDLDHYTHGEPLEARPDTLGYRTGKFIRRNRTPVIASAAAAAIVVALVVFFTIRLANARNAALAQAARTQRIQTFLLNLFDGGDKEAGPAEDLRVTTLIDRGVAEARSLNSDPAVQAEIYQTLGGVYQKLGKFDQADTLLQQSLSERRNLAAASRSDVSESEVALGLLRSDQAKLDEAERLVREGLSSLQQSLPPTAPAVIKATIALGQVLEAKGAYTEGISLMEKAAAAQDRPGVVTPELADTLGELANHHFYAGHYEIADALNQRALAMHRQIYGDTHPKVAEDLINLGASQQDRGHYAEAERYHRQALAIHEAYYGPDHPQTAASLTLVGRALYNQKHYEEAESLLHRALAIQERAHGPVHPSVASALNDLGNIATMQNRYAEAEADFQRMADIYRSIYHDHHYLIGIAQSNLATVYLNEKQYGRAESLYREAIRRFTEALSPEHVNTGIARIKLGRALLREQRYRDAEPEILAGYGIVAKQASPSVSWLVSARKDLVEVYGALHEPEKAAPFQALLNQVSAKK